MQPLFVFKKFLRFPNYKAVYLATFGGYCYTV